MASSIWRFVAWIASSKSLVGGLLSLGGIGVQVMKAPMIDNCLGKLDLSCKEDKQQRK